MMSEGIEKSELPPIPDNHGFKEGDRVSMPLWGGKAVCGTVQWIDISVGKKRYRGLAVLGDDCRYYEFHPEIAEKIK